MRVNRSRLASAVRWALLTVVFALMLNPSAADAHPLGNFTVNRYTRIEPSAGVLRVTYILDEAEIPTFQEQPDIDAGRDDFATKRADEIASNLHLTIDGQQTALVRKDFLLAEPPGQGGLPTMRLGVIYEAALSPGNAEHTATLADGNEPDRIGWREIVVRGQGDAQVSQSSAPGKDLTNELRSYPANLIQAPLDLRSASFHFTPGTVAVAAETITSPNVAPVRADSSFSNLIRKTHLGPLAFLGLFALALGFGAVHALAPGHGKSVMAAYLVGTRGRPIDAVLLGVIVAVMHTGSVLAVGFALLGLGSETDISKLYPVLTLLSGLIILALGLSLSFTRVRQYRRLRQGFAARHQHDAELDLAHKHAHEHALEHSHERELVTVGANAHAEDHGHTHPHGHDHDHETGVHSHGLGSHSHDLPEGVAPLSRRGLAVLATTGGLLPSPSAVIVLISAVSLNRLALGLGLIAVFSVGLAATLTTIGLGLVYGRNLLGRRAGNVAVLRVLPLASSCALILAGLVVTLRGVSGL